ncbi:MAG: hypothetical protein ACOVJ8_11015, partial [Sediminibacterium sp.]
MLTEIYKNKKTLFFILAIIFYTNCFSQTPTIQASNAQITYKTASGATISWTRGNGDACLVVVHQFNNSNVTPVATTTANYSSSSTFGSGTNRGSANYLVYKGTGSSVFVSGLTANTLYYA